MCLAQLFRKHFTVALDALSLCVVIKTFVVDVRRLCALRTQLNGGKLFFSIVFGTDLATIGSGLALWPCALNTKGTEMASAQCQRKNRTRAMPPSTVVETHG
jgi:hypothetical protein